MQIIDPLSINYSKKHISVVLRNLSSQESCDGEPYDQMEIAAQYILDLEKKIETQEKIITDCGENISRMKEEADESLKLISEIPKEDRVTLSGNGKFFKAGLNIHAITVLETLSIRDKILTDIFYHLYQIKR